jgi:hypothetical protein
MSTAIYLHSIIDPAACKAELIAAEFPFCNNPAMIDIENTSRRTSHGSILLMRTK